MRLHWTLDHGGTVEDVVVDVDADAPIAALAAALGMSLASIAPGADADAALADCAPVSGLVLPLRHWDAEWPDIAMRFRGGPLAGQIVPLSGSSFTVGRGSDCAVAVPDPTLSRHHASIMVSHSEVRLLRTPEAGPLRVNGRDVPEDGVAIDYDDVVELGASVVSIGRFPAAAADIARDGSGALAFNRPSRIVGYRPENRVLLPGPRPDDQERQPLPWAMAAVPVVMASGLAFVSRQPAMLMMAAASPVMVLANYRTQRRMTAKRGKTQLARWREAALRSRTQIADTTSTERREAWRLAPDPAWVREICRRPDNRLWERRRSDPDALSVRLGLAELPVPVKFDGQPAEADPPHPVMSPVPVTVDLEQAGVLGIAGPAGRPQAVGRWLALALAALRSPRDLRLVVLCDRAAAHSWEWVRWLPHTQADHTGAPAALVGNSDETRAARVRELAKEVEARLEARQDNREVQFETQVVVVVDGARRYRTIAGMATILRDGPSVGVHAICLDEDRSRLPEEATAELLVDRGDPTLGRLEVAGRGGVSRLLLDSVSPEVAEEAARALTPVRHVGGEGDDRALPATVRFADLANADLDDPEWVATRWTLGGRSTRATVGVGVDGEFALDLKADGPHALVAGTTGAGKSEFLQTWVVSLALANRPDSLTFVLVDYKGASAFADCEKLPHTVGMVTNLDNRETERALASLDAELKRRERVLKDMGAKDVDDAWDRDAARAASSHLARLVIVIDEFAELVHELPDFVTGLIRIARVGRSLGIHLVLATQRPTGVVSAEMQANIGLRVALRMVDKGDSTEVLGSPEAAYVPQSTPGRGYVRRGPGTAPDQFQTARVAGRRPGAHVAAGRLPVVRPVGWHELGEPLALRRPGAGGDDPDATDLHALVGIIRAAAESLSIPTNPSPWLPALAELITVEELRPSVSAEEGIVLGLRDVPTDQAQSVLTYRVADGEHLLIAGSARSGRSTVLRTLIAGLAERHGPQDVHLYCIDYGNGALLPARDLPHCGAVVTGTESERFVRLLGRLIDELGRRQLMLAAEGYGDINEQRAAQPDAALPYLVVAVDRWEGLLSAFGVDELQPIRERVVKILREGPAVGVRVVIAGDQALLTDRVAGFIETRYILRLADRADYRLANIRPHTLPETIPAGRAYYGDPANEVQFAVISADPSGQAQALAFRELVADIRRRSDAAPQQGTRPFRLDVLPPAISLPAALALPEQTHADPACSFVVGVGGDELSQFRGDFSAGYGFLVAGQRRTGRSTALATILTSLTSTGVRALVVTPKVSPLTAAAERLGVPLLRALDATSAERVGDMGRDHDRLVVMIDDAELVHGSELDAAVIELVRERGSAGVGLVVGSLLDDISTLLRGVAVEAKRHKQGLLLSPSSSLEGNALGLGIPRAMLGRAPAGRALLMHDGEWVPVQVPVPDGNA